MLPGFEPENQKKATLVYERLIAKYGEEPLAPFPDPMLILIRAILSSQTKGEDTDQALVQMLERYGSWEAIRDAPVEDLIETISPVTYPETKAPQIQRTLGRIFSERGEASIDFLSEKSTEAANQWLQSLDGAGQKTAHIVLLFCFSRPVLPVETHLKTVSERLGLIPEGTSADRASRILMDILPRDAHKLSNFYSNMHKHGKKVCTNKWPKCEKCPLTDLCDWYKKNRG